MARVRLWCAVLAWGLPATAGAVTQDDFKIVTAQDVVDVCSVPESDEYYALATAFCHGYMVGTYDVYEALNARKDAKHFVCPPEPPPPRTTVIAEFVSWMNAHRQYGGEHPTNAIFKFLVEKWPCKKQG
jgi:hypothetical protein